MSRDSSLVSTKRDNDATNREIQAPFADDVAARVRRLAAAARFSASSLGKVVGVSSSSAALYWSGKRPWPLETLPRIAAALGVGIEFLLTGENLQIRTGGRDDDDLVDVASVDLAYGMGGTFLDAGDVDVERVPFSRAWLRQNVTDAPPEVLGVAQGVGDSMEPVLSDRDLVFFDRSARLEEHVSDKMWVFAYGQIGMIKRLRPLPDGTIKIMSANRTYPDEIAPADDIHIIGRVVGSFRRH